MEKNIKDYLHLYLGCEVLIESSNFMEDNKPEKIIDTLIEVRTDDCISCKNYTPPVQDIKPILRPLSDITDEEVIESALISNCLPYGWDKHLTNFKIIETKYPNKGKEVKVGKYSFCITEAAEFYFYDYDKRLCIYASKTPQVILYLLSKHFDLFDLIEAGLAINKTKV